MRHVITEPEDASRLEVASGDELVFRLEQQSSGGYLWSVGEVPEFLSEVVAGVEPVERAQPGRLRTAALALRATGPGSGQLVLVLRRPWESEPIEQRRINVQAR